VKEFLRLFLFCLYLLTGSAYASKQVELNNLRHHIAKLQQQLEKTSESKSEAADALRESERAISTSHRKLFELTKQQHKTKRTLSKLQRQGRHLKKDIRDQQKQLGKLLYQLNSGGKQEFFMLLLNNRDPNQLVREMQYYEYISRSRADWLDTLRAKLKQLKSVEAETKLKNTEIALLRTELKSQKQTLNKDKRTRKQVLGKIASQLKLQRRKIGRLRRNENRISKLVTSLAKILKKSKVKNKFNNKALPGNHFDGYPFAQLKGKLILPVKGNVSNTYGAKHQDSTVRWKGLFLRAAANRPVKTVAAGRVVYADWLRGFGNLLVVDHGKGYMSLYGNNETLYKQVGDVLHGGDTIAAVGNSGGNAKSSLYFELRHKGYPMNPMKWIRW